MSDIEVEKQARIDACFQIFRDACIERGHVLSADGRVGEEDAAELLGCAAGTLRNRRTAGIGPTYYSRGVGGSKVSYRLLDIAAWLEDKREWVFHETARNCTESNG